MFEVKGHILHKDGKAVAQKATPNMGGVMTPKLLVMHYTAGFTASSAIATLTNGKAKQRTSAHLVLDRDGTFTQLAPLNRVCWHAGESAFKGRSGCNSFSIGIEMVNCGPVKQRADGKLFPEVAPSKTIPASDCEAARHPNGEATPFWQKYPEAQFEAALGAALAIFDAYGFSDVAGHYDIAPRRKRDPGPAWPMALFKSRLAARDADGPEADDDNNPPPPPAAPGAFASPVLRKGMQNDHVAALQWLLNINGATPTPLKQDGDFGFKTELALIAFQKARGLTVDGVAGAEVWAALRLAKAA